MFVTDDGSGCFCCRQAVKHIEKIYNYCAKNVAAKALVSIEPLAFRLLKKISHRQLGPLRGSSSPFQHFEPARVKPN